MIREPHLFAVGTADDARLRPRAGVAFVPCLICLAPLDLALLAESDGPQLCDDHAPGDYLPLQ
jgi:hypothetical protein